LDLLRRGLAHRRYNIKVTREIEEGRNLNEILPQAIHSDVELRLEQRWWLERLFDKMGLSFVQGALLIYGLIEIPRVIFFVFILSRTTDYFVAGNGFGFFGDLIIPISLLILHSVYKEIVKLRNEFEEMSKSNRFVAPPIVLKGMSTTQKSVSDTDVEYRDRYIKPVMLKTMQFGFDLLFKPVYQLGSGVIPAMIFFFVLFFRYVIQVLPPSFFTIAVPNIPEISIAYSLYSFFLLDFLWFLAGVLAWSLFMAWIINVQASGNTVGFRPFESVREYFARSLALTFKILFSLVILVSWVSPFVLVWSVLPTETFIRQGVANFVESFVILMIAAIVISVTFPIVKVQKGLENSRLRALMQKRLQLEDIMSFKKSKPVRYLRIQKHLIEDYKDIRDNPRNVLSTAQVFQISISIFLPIASFFLSRG
jgi:hypothetical protein